ncbi:MAG: single-stranded DNA-binding protein [Candidatus Parcubacteria bacterium]|nr:single-stranded DNA-binding protein [Candidatus Parcubacteria bacterium]
MYLNKAILIGNLTRDPEIKALPSGIKVTSFSLATNFTRKDKNGVKQDFTDFHNVVVFGIQAENVARYLTKGSSVLVEGRMTTRSWDKDGVKHYRTEVVADRVQFGPRPGTGAPTGAPQSQGGNAPRPQNGAGNAKQPEPMDTSQYPEEDVNLEDIPF